MRGNALFLQELSVRQEAAEGEAVFAGFQAHVIVRFRLGRDVFIEAVLLPQARILDVAGDAGDEVQGPRFIALEVLDMAPVAIGVEVRREDGIDAILVEEGHPQLSFRRKAFGTRFWPAGKAILKRVLVHEDDFPFLLRLSHVFFEPGHFVFIEAGLEVGQFLGLRVEDDEVDVTIIEGVELVLVFFHINLRQGEEVQIGFGHADFPVLIIRFVVSQEWDDGDAGDHVVDDVEPGIPLVVVLAVIDEVAHVDEELGVLVALPCRLCRGGPDAVVAGLGVREDEGLEVIALGRVEGLPAAALVAGADAVFIGRTRFEVGDGGRVDVRRHAIVAEGVAGSGELHEGSIVAGFAVFDDGLIFGVVRLPHEGPRRRAVRRDDLADVGGIDGLRRQVVGRRSLGGLDALLGDGLRTGQPGIGTDSGDDGSGQRTGDDLFIFCFHSVPPIFEYTLL